MKRGITLKPEQLPELIAALVETQDEAQAEGLLE